MIGASKHSRPESEAPDWDACGHQTFERAAAVQDVTSNDIRRLRASESFILKLPPLFDGHYPRSIVYPNL